MAVLAATLLSSVAACGGADTSPVSSTGEKAADTAPAGGGQVDKAALKAKMKKETGGELPDKTMDCMVDAMLKTGDQATLQDIISGKVSVNDDFKAFGAKEKEVQRAVSDCG
ncbi:hypothetical protein OIE66_36550 [Nonomuraea sp. NBC_01738]|uniref:hypothetical protein n=1 Tax=Nonomuraea sp. NBC_01738 TaxID=2976003 RepID=UPI002E135FA4|nr:hypothetical protein OIE66_36550 [Nonomuraea sp. NBC_01738]